MSVIIKLKHPEKLIKALCNEIKLKKNKFWEMDEDGHLTHTPDRYYKRAWFNPVVDVTNEEIVFKYIREKNAEEDKALFAMYHGRFIKMILSNYYKKFEMISAEIK